MKNCMPRGAVQGKLMMQLCRKLQESRDQLDFL
jgi:hypothetical protein